MSKQFYVLEMNKFTKDEAMEFLNDAFKDAKYGPEQGMALAHLNEKGVQNLKEHVFKQKSVD